jgi:hypothetical protein
LFQDDRIETFYCDQLDQASIHQLWSQMDQARLDIIVEDGLDTFEASISFLEGSIARLRPRGIYVIEDIMTSKVDRWKDQLESIYSKRYPSFAFAFVRLPSHSNSFGNNLLVILRGLE